MSTPPSLRAPLPEARGTFDSQSAHWRTRYVLRLIHHQKGNIQLSLKTLSVRVGITEQHLGRAFRAATGLPFRLYLRHVRAAEAKRLLDDPSLSVKEVAARLGYSEPANFIKDFRMMTRMTPIEYRLHAASIPD